MLLHRDGYELPRRFPVPGTRGRGGGVKRTLIFESQLTRMEVPITISWLISENSIQVRFRNRRQGSWETLSAWNEVDRWPVMQLQY